MNTILFLIVAATLQVVYTQVGCYCKCCNLIEGQTSICLDSDLIHVPTFDIKKSVCSASFCQQYISLYQPYSTCPYSNANDTVPGMISAAFFDDDSNLVLPVSSVAITTPSKPSIPISFCDGCYCGCCFGSHCNTTNAGSLFTISVDKCLASSCVKAFPSSCPAQGVEGEILAAAFGPGGSTGSSSYSYSSDGSSSTTTTDGSGIGVGSVLIFVVIAIVVGAGIFFIYRRTRNPTLIDYNVGYKSLS